MTHAPFLIAALDAAAHDRSQFDSGTLALDRYLREQVSQDIRRRVAACFVALTDERRVAGYYTLATASVPLADLPDGLRRKLPRYGSVPAIRMGRLAVDAAFKGQGLGGALLVNALRRAASSEIPAVVLIVDAKDDQAAAFYRHHASTPLADSPLTLFLPLASVR
ncbi:GNAT family N-acetyltransferase [Verminephrobacter aporrectodeae subsp. tuberculatae]|uniref:GNAT family N-acetyltransferase n=1 Tax=Verminephrobacter aporrectodeae subsp. tuberculatae TaxID=1110392 RepID=A0ABT3KRG8_9BURK|nr:GNAT family N-acetyltransferase [Verminephrobacter aporrectodeae]MCW5220141.1 GNAT family N-acetyltransferase [Verminephrobacter aporrectodeae subsp. tuberculatae]MCW5289429.1 GNAT family N-acetyltransferase [Verminephrobacter aporrectodeae subsp. tuberculatae]MCW5320910.1 GNAT family N-acetyltransferase [Verminephrobacter aporrectodeae subsp. tuberculatae]MCW8165620.1 GNAT family N-acetyltransferase [Verminephrobacter aporrectodeae subsp. tuberculatae]MCW8168397.1 GNAT family N-acetyltrans